MLQTETSALTLGAEVQNLADINPWLFAQELGQRGRLIPILGEGMEPRLRDGDQVLGELIDPDNWEQLCAGQVYAVEHGDGRFVIRRLTSSGFDAQGSLVLQADTTRALVVIPRREIYRVWRVLFVVYGPVV